MDERVGDCFWIAEEENAAPASSCHSPASSPVRTSSMRARSRARAIASGRSEAPVTGVTRTGLKIGDEMPDGTIYAGISPDTGKATYTMPQDAPGAFTFNSAARYAETLDAHSHKDWRVPTQNELDVLYQNRDKGKLKRTFDETGLEHRQYSCPGRYWSSSAVNDSGWSAFDDSYAKAKCFNDGKLYRTFRDFPSSLRCVRG